MTARTAIVTGASRGLGRAIALELAREGVALVVAARSRNDLAHVAAEAERLGAPAVLAVEADLSVAAEQIGRASCRERVCQYVYISVVAVSLKQNTVVHVTRSTHIHIIHTHASTHPA